MKKRRKAPTVAKLKKTAWNLLSEVIRHEAAERDDGEYVACYTCGAIHPWKSGITGMNAGHAIPMRHGAVLLDEEIISPQCNKCNAKPPFGKGGEYHIFATKLIREKAEEIERLGTMVEVSESPFKAAIGWWESKLQASRQVRKWTRGELEEKIESYKARLEAL